MKYAIILFGLCFFLNLTSCKKCYECSKRCGTCTKAGSPPLAGCNGDEALNNFSVESWKLYLEGQGYSCSLTDIKEETCNETEKDLKQSNNYSCASK